METKSSNFSSYKNEKTKTTFELPLKLLCSWLKMLKDKTQNKDIEHALRTIQFVAITDSERDIVATIRQLYISEMNGDLDPPPSMREIYEFVEDYLAEFE